MRTIVITVVLIFGLGSVVAVESNRPENAVKFKIVPQPPRSELQQLAGWFHQDWKVLFGDARSCAQTYTEQLLTEERRRKLGAELLSFLETNKNVTDAELLKAWYGLGAQGWQMSISLREALRAIALGLG